MMEGQEKLGLPDSVINQLKEHIANSCNRTEQWYKIDFNERDITGALLLSLHTPEWQYCEGWQWKITTESTRGRDTEKESGADGIISISFDNGVEKKHKSILLQAKKENDGDKRRLEKQIENMDKILLGGNMLVIYDNDEILGKTPKLENKIMGFADYMSDVFFACENGCFCTLEEVQKKIEDSKQEPPAYSASIEVKKSES
jgi:hypothetical protein